MYKINSGSNLTALLGINDKKLNLITKEKTYEHDKDEEETDCQYNYNSKCHKKYIIKCRLIIQYITIVLYYIFGISFLVQNYDDVYKCNQYDILWYTLYAWCVFPLITIYIYYYTSLYKFKHAIFGIIINIICIVPLLINLYINNYKNCSKFKNSNFYDYIVVTTIMFMFSTVFLIINLMMNIVIKDCSNNNDLPDDTDNLDINNEKINDMDCSQYN